MAKEKLKEIIGAVDTKKVLEASYTLSPSKFNGVASTYTKFVYLMALLNLNSDESEKVSVAESTIGKIKNPHIRLLMPCITSKGNPITIQAIIPLKSSPNISACAGA